MRVLHCIYDDPENPWVGGGGAVRLRELYRRLAGEVDVTVATGRFPGARDETIDGIHYRRLGSAAPYALSRLTYAAAATRLLARGDYDAAVFDFSVYTPLRIPTDRPVGITVHHLTGPSARGRWGATAGSAVARLERRMIRRARSISATSHATREQLERIARPGTQIVHVPAGVPDSLFSLTRREAGYVLYFGRLDWYQKGLDVLLDAVARLVRDRPHLRVVLAGRGKDAERVAAYADQLGIRGNLEMRGAVSDEARDELLAGALALLMPSRFEGFGMVAAEAMAAGVPVVAAAAGSLPEVVDPPAGGVLVPVGDAAALALAAGALLDDEPARTALGKSARRSAERFRWDAVARRHLEFLKSIRRGAPPTSAATGA